VLFRESLHSRHVAYVYPPVLVLCCGLHVIRLWTLTSTARLQTRCPSTFGRLLSRVAIYGLVLSNTERAVNMRFNYASRRVRVPHIHPGYAR